MIHKILSLLGILLLTSCNKFDWHNPYDPECPKELFTPSSPGATMEGNSVKLTWSQQNDDISGFALFRSAEGEKITNLTQIQKSTTQYLDASITPGKKYTYYILAVAGTNKSDTIRAEITPLFPVSVASSIISQIGSDSALVDSEILSGGGGLVEDRGVCWSITSTPTVNNNKVSSGAGIGKFSVKLTGLQSGRTYYVRAYGQNSRGVSYGNEITFTTIGEPKIATSAITDITSISASTGGNVESDGGAPVTARGVCWSKSPNPTINNSKTVDGMGTGTFTSTLVSLEPGTLYYVRAYAQNRIGISYGAQLTFTTSIAIPVITSTSVSNLTSTTATSGGSISTDGGAPVTARGVCWSTSPSPTVNGSKTLDGSGTGNFVSQLVGLKASTTYYLRAYATNSFTTVYGEQITFTTPASGPLQIGDTFEGGIVAYFFKPGDNGFARGYTGILVAEQDLSLRFTWRGGSPNNDIFSTLSDEVGFGDLNTKKILELATTFNFNAPAAEGASKFLGGNNIDWFLPSQKELLLVKGNLADKGLGNFTKDTYWTSSVMTNLVGGIAIGFTPTAVICGCSYFESYLVRPIRYFK
jgi:hypothetical protein